LKNNELPARQEPFRLNVLKLAPSTPALRAIVREQVASLIVDSNATLTLVTAPAGFGKTMSMSQVYRAMKQQKNPVAWLTLDAADNDLGRIGMYVSAALHSILPEKVTDVSELKETPGDFSTSNSRIYRLLDEIVQIGTPFALFLDECEHLTNPEVLAFIDSLLASLESGQRLIIGSRRTPNLHLGRLRVQGRLIELDIDTLRFSENETRLFVQARMQIDIADNALQALHSQTEGWPAALQLATMSTLLGKSGTTTPPRQLQGSIADYLAEDVLARLPHEQRAFLLRSSLFETFCPAMCDDVFGTADSQDWIDKTVAENLFLNKIDVQGNWYRYHPLFHEFLQRECAAHFGGEVRLLHVRAASWLGDAGRTSSGITHACIASDHDLAANLMEQCAMRYVRTGQVKAVCDWLALLPDACLLQHPGLMIAGAYANTYLHKYSEAARMLANLDRIDTSNLDITYDVLLIKVMLAVWSDDLNTAFDTALSSQDKFPDSERYVAGIIQNVVAYNHASKAYFFFCHQALAAAKRALVSIDALHGLSYAAWLEGSLSLCQGDVHGSRAKAALSLPMVPGHKYSSSDPVSAVHLLETLYEMNDLDMMAPIVKTYLPLIRETCIPDQIIIAHRVAARMHVLRNEQAEALEILNLLQDLGDARNIARFAAAARLDRIWIASRSGDLSTVNRLLPLVSIESIWKPFQGISTFAEDIEDPQIASFRYAILTGDGARVIAPIEVAIQKAEGTHRRRRVLRLQCLLAQSYEMSRRRQRGLDILERALTTAQSLGLVRVFADESWYMAPLLEALSLRNSPIKQDYLFMLLELAKQKPASEHEVSSGNEPETDSPLSPRERQILVMLAEGHSNKELAARVQVAESTIETYLHRINTKLGTRNRTQAVARGRELGIIGA
jgi:LuxR family maltose regulon positive regulatory protein